MAEHTLVSVGRDGSHDSRSYASERAARAMAEWLARLSRYNCHVLVTPDGTPKILGPDGRDSALLAAPREQVGLDFTRTEARIAAWLGGEIERREGPALPETYGRPGFMAGPKRQAD